MKLEEIYKRIDELSERDVGIKSPPLTDAERDELKSLFMQANEIEMDLAYRQTIKKQGKSQEMKRRRDRGKYGEQRLAKKVGGVVVGRSKWIAGIQINCQQPPDVIAPVGNPVFSFESKWLKSVPKMLDKVMIQAVKNAPQGLTPIGVIGDREQHIVYYIMCEKDWLDYHRGTN